MASMTEGVLCPNCNKRSVHEHMCMQKSERTKITLDEIKKLAYTCINCGRVADSEDKLCQPVPLDEKQKERFVKVPLEGSTNETCKNCQQPVTPPGHICDPRLPYTCEYCGARVENYRHMCKEIVEKAKYTCNSCGRIAVTKDRLCAPIELK